MFKKRKILKTCNNCKFNLDDIYTVENSLWGFEQMVEDPDEKCECWSISSEVINEEIHLLKSGS